MKMKLFLMSLALLLILGVGIVSANNEPNGNPFQTIWDAISDLQNQINNLSGQHQSVLRVVDANNAYVGDLMDKVEFNGSAVMRVYNRDLKLFFLSSLAGEINSDQNTEIGVSFYKSTDCSGDVYYPNTYSPYEIYIDPYTSVDRYYIVDGPLISFPQEFNSHRDYQCWTDTFMAPDTFKLKKFTLPVFTAPLRIVE